MKKIILKIDGMSCSACSESLSKYLNKQDGINANVNLVMATALINYDENKYSLNDIEKFIEDVGFKSLGNLKKKKQDNSKKYLIIYLVLLLLIMFLMLINMFHLNFSIFNKIKYPTFYSILMCILTVPFLIYGKDLLINGYNGLKHRRPNMNSLVTIGIVSCFLYSFVNMILIILGNNNLVHNLYFESAAMIIYFVKLGQFISSRSREKARSAIEELVQITPEYATLKNGNRVTIDEVKKGDILKALGGEKIPVDAVITRGSCHIDESFITGESIYNKKQIGDKVLAGSILIDGIIEIEALKIGKDSMISEVIRLVNESVNTKTKIQKQVDIICSYFVPFVLIISIFSFFINLLIGINFTNSFITMVTVLVVSCPCSMGLATPLAIVTSEGLCAKLGILVKNSEIFERTSKINTIVFDKTGTLTYGDLRISRLANYSNYSNEKLLEIVACLEKNVSHPIKNAFKNYKTKYEVLNFKNLTGKGITGVLGRSTYYIGNNKILDDLKIENTYKEIEKEFINLGNSVLYVIENKKIIGLIGIKDIIRKNTKKVINKLKEMNLDLYILTGDNEVVSNMIGKTIDIDNSHIKSSLLPKDKLKHLKEMKKIKTVMMIGDGINDAPSLALSDVSVSIESATDISKNTSDVILLNNNLKSIVDLINISKKTVKIIKENLFWALFYNLIMISIALGIFKHFGITLTPHIASLAMVISSLTVVFNSLRIKKGIKSK